LDVATGESRWKRPRTRQANWSSPAVLRGATPEEDVVLLQSGWGISAHDPRTGEPLWKYEGGSNIIPSPTAIDGVVYLASGGLTALRPGEGEPEVVWTNERLGPNSASPLVHQDRVYVIRGGGVLNCGNAQTGEELWDVRLGGNHWGTPVVACEHLYAIDQEGVARVVRIAGEGEGELVAEIEFGESVLASPAVSDGALFVRTGGHLWKIAETP
jgi:outer membrane protein assembly factor BamB